MDKLQMNSRLKTGSVKNCCEFRETGSENSLKDNLNPGKSIQVQKNIMGNQLRNLTKPCLL